MAIDREKVLQAAQKLVEKKRWDKAIVEYQRLVAEDPKDARTLLKIGDLHLKLEQYAEAIATYERVGQFYSLQGFSLKAIAVYKQIREIIHKHAPHLEDRFGHIVPRLAELYTQLGLTSDALAAYDEMATRLQRAGRDRDAIDIFKKVVDLDPSNPLPYLRLAEAFVRVKDVDSAITRFAAAGEILLKLGRRDDALKVFERLLQHRQDGRFARIASEIYLARGGPSDAMAALAKLQISFKENPKDLDTLSLLARIFDALGQPAKSIEVQKEAARIARDAGSLHAFDALVEALVARAPDDEAVKQLVAQRAKAASSIPAPMTEPPDSIAEVDVDEEEVEIEEVEVESEAAPFALRQSHHALPAVEPVDPVARARAALARAESLRATRKYDEAIALLRDAIVDAPNARELHEKLCDTLIEAGDQDGAVLQMLAFATTLANTRDVEAAARVLDEILLLEPDRPEALRMLRELGYAVPGSYAEPAAEPAAAPQAYAAAPVAEYAAPEFAAPEYDAPEYEAPELAAPEIVAPSTGAYHDAPLPSYDLEEVSADQAMSQAAPAAARPLSTSQLDDPFAGASLPSFPIEEDATQFMEAPPPFSARAVHPAEVAPAPAAQLDEDALEEAEFFVTHGMFDEARAIVDEQLSRLPNHPLLLERKREIEAAAAAAAPVESPSGAREVPVAAAGEVDRSFDIAASLEALDALDAPAPAADPTADDPRQVSVESVFEQFKAGVAAQISESDAATHYDLGVAYKEMGLVEDAIHEFSLAARDPGRECVCWSMIGMLRLQRGEIEQAIDAFILGLHATQRTTEQELALNYEIGNAYEMHAPENALYYFQLVARIDPSYRDPRGAVQDRIARLTPAAKPAPARAAGDPFADDFDAAFDELLGSSGKLP